MLKKWLAPLSAVERLIAFIMVVLLLGSTAKSLYYTLQNGGCDLRTRVVGARLLSTSESPYFYKWKPGDPEQLLDPNDKPDRVVNGVSSAPGALYVQALFNRLEYPAIRIAWMVVHYLLAAYILGFFLCTKDVSYKRKLGAAGISSVFFLCTAIWFYNIERGQIYILFAFFFCLLYQLYAAPKPWAHFLAGILLIFAVFCRPTFAVVGIPFLMVRNRWLLAGLLAGALPLAVHVLTYYDLWKDYQEAMNIYTGFRDGTPAFAHNFSTSFPSSIEGATNLGYIKTDFIVGRIAPLANHLWQLGLPGVFYILSYTGVALLCLLLFRKDIRAKDPATVVLLGFLLYITAEYLVPAPRGPYNVIEWIVPVLLLLQGNRLSLPHLVVLMAGLCLMVGFPFTLPYSGELGELLLVFCLLQFLRNTKANQT